jgi:hypothetical protein
MCEEPHGLEEPCRKDTHKEANEDAAYEGVKECPYQFNPGRDIRFYEPTAVVGEIANTQKYDNRNCIVHHSLTEYDTKEFGILIRLNHCQTSYGIGCTYRSREYHHLVDGEFDDFFAAPHLNPPRLIDVVRACEDQKEGDDGAEYAEEADVEEVLEETPLIEIIATRVDNQWQ